MRERPCVQMTPTRWDRITPARAGKTVRAGNRLREPRDHPRSCGKDGQHHHDRNRRRGSPPLVRERPMMWTPYCSCKGITPARAGKTFINNLQGSLGKDHPRSCGKDFSGDGPVLLQIGSPPLVRERLVPHHNVGHVGRITPARAGKTHHYLLGQGIVRDHPRSCGKDLLMSDNPVWMLGSPPLVRERLSEFIGPKLRTRITPARAGKTK